MAGIPLRFGSELKTHIKRRKRMTKDEKLDEFMKRIGIELSPFQKEIIKKIADENKIYMCYPPHVGRYESLRLIQALVQEIIL